MGLTARAAVAASTGTLRVNFGCGNYPLYGWLNVDEDPLSGAEVFKRVPPISLPAESVTEIYAGHFLEHLSRVDAAGFLDEAHRVLEPGGRIGIMVPDTRECFRRYVFREPAPMEYPAGTWRDLRDLDELCDGPIYSTFQRSPHLWCYDKETLGRLLERHGFVVDGEFDRFGDPRVAVGAWYQFGLDAHKPPKADR